jgi:hypothetical protein
MSSRPRIEWLLSVLGLQTAATQSSEADEAVALRYADGLVCVLAMDASGGVLASTPIAFIHQNSPLSLFEKALRLNGSREDTDGGIIGYDAVLSQLEYSIRIPAHALDSVSFPAEIAQFLQHAIALRSTLTDASSTSAA